MGVSMDNSAGKGPAPLYLDPVHELGRIAIRESCKPESPRSPRERGISRHRVNGKWELWPEKLNVTLSPTGFIEKFFSPSDVSDVATDIKLGSISARQFSPGVPDARLTHVSGKILSNCSSLAERLPWPE
jgi:hypothetical protein